MTTTKIKSKLYFHIRPGTSKVIEGFRVYKSPTGKVLFDSISINSILPSEEE